MYVTWQALDINQQFHRHHSLQFVSAQSANKALQTKVCQIQPLLNKYKQKTYNTSIKCFSIVTHSGTHFSLWVQISPTRVYNSPNMVNGYNMHSSHQS